MRKDLAQVVKSSPYEAAGEQAAIEILRGIEAQLEKNADLDVFQLESLLTIIKNDIAPLILFTVDAKLPFIYLALKKIVESMLTRLQKAQKQYEQKEYSYGFPAAEEMSLQPGAFEFNPF